MSTARALKPSALLCALLLGLCTLATYPFVEMAQCDDFGYVRSAKAFAETGHFVYFGWASAMLGWQILLGGLFIKLFGFSFTAAFASVLLVSLATSFLLQRNFVYMGLTEVNASFATLTLVLSPLFLPLSFSFMSDIPGYFAIVVCLYLCLRAIRSTAASHTTAWLIGAALSNALLGTARQTGWLGMLILVPSTCWILRKGRLPFVLLGVVWLASLGIIFGCLHWFGLQMYTTVETSGGAAVDSEHLFNLVVTPLRIVLEVTFLLVPILIAFVSPFLRHNKRIVSLSMLGVVAVCAFALLRPHSYWMETLLVPSLTGIGSYVTVHGILEIPGSGNRPIVLNPVLRLVLSVVSYFSGFACLALIFAKKSRHAPALQQPAPPAQDLSLPWRELLILLMPFALAYSGFLFWRAFTEVMFDRYVLPLFMVPAVMAVRFYQDQFGARLPRTCFAALAVFAVCSILATHDFFATSRARLAAADQLRSAGLARTDFYAGFPYDGWTEIDSNGYVEVEDIRTPAGIRQISGAWLRYKPCNSYHARFFPAIRPSYVLSYDNSSCGHAQQRFAPQPYHLWLPPFSGAIYTQSVSPEQLGEPGP